jgi:molybdopterin/thiamine biosynthesis adenylyltransferase/rhodanese-related sulfurtransferase
MELVALDPEETERYSRHLLIPEVGLAGQQKLKDARVLCIGAGGLGSPAALYLAAAGVGRIGLVDFDVVDLSNLQRQILHGEKDVGRKKIHSARDRIAAGNSATKLDLHDCRLTSENAVEIIRPYDVVIDGSDNFPTRYLSNDVCVFLEKPNVYGSVFRFDGQATVFGPHLGGPCYRCLFPEPPPPGAAPSCAEAGVLGVLPGLVGVLQATEAIKLILGIGKSLLGRLLHVDALSMRFREFNLRRDPACPVCGEQPTITVPIDYEAFCRGQDRASEMAPSIPELSVFDLKKKLESGDRLVLVDVREPFEFEIAKIPGSRLFPLGQLAQRAEELTRAAPTVLICKSGGRSQRAAEFLQSIGFENVFNLAGGVTEWAEKIDPAMRRY